MWLRNRKERMKRLEAAKALLVLWRQKKKEKESKNRQQ
jgi:hypothetical protein